MRSSQTALVQEMVDYPSGIAVLGMGGGKTCSALTATKKLVYDHKAIDSAIVLAPPRTLRSAWAKEPEKWEHLEAFDVRVLDGSPASRATKLRNGTYAHGVDVFSHNVIPWLVKFLREERLDLSRILLIIDEISKFKNPRSKWGKELMKIADQFAGVWAMTGTPRPNGIEDLFLPIKIVGGKDVWGIRSFDEWRRENFMPMDYHGYKWKVHGFRKPSLEAIAKEWMVIAPTPDLKKPPLNTGDDFVQTVTMTSEQKAHYERMMEEMYTEIARWSAGGMIDDEEMALIQAMSQGVVSMKLTQLAQGFIYDETTEPIRLKENPKLDMMAEMDDNLGGDSAVICYGFREEIAQLTELFEKQGRRVALLGGGVSAKKADATIDAWTRGEIDRLLLHPLSAGHGVDGLQFGGHHVIWYHPTWSSEMYDQTINRIWRPGQTQECFNWWISMDQSVDLIKYARVESKLEEEEAFRQILRRLV